MAKILLVEDEQFTRELYKELLEGAGFSVDVANDGEEGYNKAFQGGYDLILLDIIMPKLDGLTVLKRLKQTSPNPPNKKIVMLTALNTDEHIKESLANGADGYFMKSALNPDALINEVRSIINR